VGDEINTLDGRLELLAIGGTLIGVYPFAWMEAQVDSLRLLRGNAWFEHRGDRLFQVEIAGVRVGIRNALLFTEPLRSGYKVQVLEGGVYVLDANNPSVSGDKLNSPLTLLIGQGKSVIQQPGVGPNLAEEHRLWRSAFPNVERMEPVMAELDDNQRQQLAMLEKIALALQAFHRDVGSFPDPQKEGLQSLVQAPDGVKNWKGPYHDLAGGGGSDIPTDTWGTPVVYALLLDPANGNQQPTALLFSLGPDKTFQEGEGDDIGLQIPPPAMEIKP
jgi:hypothetical protein